MKKNTVFNWRLSERPSVDNILKLVERGIITKEDAKKIVLNEEEINQTDLENKIQQLVHLYKLIVKN